MMQAADAFVKNNYKPAPFHSESCYKHDKLLLDGLHFRYVEQGKERFSTVALFLETKIQQRKLSSHSVLSIFTSDIVLFAYDATHR